MKHPAEKELIAILNTLVDGVIIIDSKGIIQLCNPAFGDIFGYQIHEAIGKNVKFLMPEKHSKSHDGYIQSYLETGQNKIIGIGRETTALHKDGTKFPIDLSVGETSVSEEKIFVGIIKDLTKRHKRQQAFDSLKEQHYYLARAAAMNEMGSAIAHELNQPLAAAITYMETAKLLNQSEGVDTAKMEEVLDLAIEQSQRASDIINRMRSFLKRGDITRKQKNVSDLIGSSLQLTTAIIHKYDVTVKIMLSDHLPDVLASRVQVQQVLINLIRNACEAMEDQEERLLSITAKISECKAFIEISVSDTGTGLSQSARDRLFVPFSSDKETGMGVGLSISQSIINQHDGQLWARDNKPKGVVFIFTLPISGAL